MNEKDIVFELVKARPKAASEDELTRIDYIVERVVTGKAPTGRDMAWYLRGHFDTSTLWHRTGLSALADALDEPEVYSEPEPEPKSEPKVGSNGRLMFGEKQTRDALNYLEGAFTWSDHEYGHRFWCDRADALSRLLGYDDYLDYPTGVDDEGMSEAEKCGKAATALMTAFTWTETEQGSEFWRKAYDALREMADY